MNKVDIEKFCKEVEMYGEFVSRYDILDYQGGYKPLYDVTRCVKVYLYEDPKSFTKYIVHIVMKSGEYLYYMKMESV